MNMQVLIDEIKYEQRSLIDKWLMKLEEVGEYTEEISIDSQGEILAVLDKYLSTQRGGSV